MVSCSPFSLAQVRGWVSTWGGQEAPKGASQIWMPLDFSLGESGALSRFPKGISDVLAPQGTLSLPLGSQLPWYNESLKVGVLGMGRAKHAG